MKILNSIQKSYEDQLSINEKLKAKVEPLLKREIKKSWFFDSRLKALESFALKIETGRFNNPNSLEDFFGCLIVVENINEIRVAVEKISKHFEIVERRPKDDSITHKDTNSFQFDDLRIYVKLKPTDFLPPEPIDNVVFEIQIKTFLQHAWAISTHDLIYKSDKISWSRERVAFQIKAMLEQAEVSISGVDTLAELPELSKENFKTKNLKEIKDLIIKSWSSDDLPNDILRLSTNVMELLNALKIPVEELRIYLEKENGLGKGTNIRNLSPYNIIVQTLINQSPGHFLQFLKNRKSRFRILVPSEIELNGIDISNSENIVRIQ